MAKENNPSFNRETQNFNVIAKPQPSALAIQNTLDFDPPFASTCQQSGQRFEDADYEQAGSPNEFTDLDASADESESETDFDAEEEILETEREIMSLPHPDHSSPVQQQELHRSFVEDNRPNRYRYDICRFAGRGNE